MRLKTMLAAAACVGMLATPAVAQDKKVRLQIGGAFPSSTTILGPAQQRTIEMLRTLSNGSIDAKLFEPGALVPANQYFDAVASGSLDAAWTGSAFFTGKDIADAILKRISITDAVVGSTSAHNPSEKISDKPSSMADSKLEIPCAH